MSRPHRVTPAALHPAARSIGPTIDEMHQRINQAAAVHAHGAAIEATGRRYTDNPDVIRTRFPQPDRAQRWYRWPGAAERALP